VPLAREGLGLRGHLGHRGDVGPGDEGLVAAPVSTTARTAWATSTARPREVVEHLALMALSLSGRFMVRRATGPSRCLNHRLVVRRHGGVCHFCRSGRSRGPPCAEPARGDVVAQQHRRAVLVVAELAVQHVGDGEHRVEPDEVGELERTHRVVEPELRGLVDVFGGAEALLGEGEHRPR
jgi:hypothetical protein